MNLQHARIKIFIEGELTVDLEKVAETFHGWISQQSLPELLIDVVDYRHVPQGPGVVLVGHEADYGLDNIGNRYGLIYNRKAPLDGTNEDKLLQATKAAAKVCSLLEAEFDSLRFSRREFELTINDRALAPNTAKTRQTCEPIFASFVTNQLGVSEFDTDFDRAPRATFGANITLRADLDFTALGND